MPRYCTAEVTEVLTTRRGLQRFGVRMPDGSPARAYALTELVGTAEVGDLVVCNTTAVDRSLGTGGWHIVHWNTSRAELDLAGPDHIMKLRYTSLQADVGTSELIHGTEADAPLDERPVVVCTVHSQMAMVALGFAQVAPGARLAYVMTDGAALPLALSDLVAQLVDRKLLVGTVTAGHAFGGDLEAVTPASALGLAAHVLRADAIVVCMGPGVVGTGTAMGTTAIEAAGLLDTARHRGGRPVLCCRFSEGDSRPRHLGLSHHVTSVLELTDSIPAVAAIPTGAADLPGVEPHDVERADVRALLDHHGLEVTTMGRRFEQDRVFFEAATAAGQLAGSLSADAPGAKP
ncbi:MAG: DUF3866 family protein [Microthrixaceae bacterium]